jgi:hypothetical protein
MRALRAFLPVVVCAFLSGCDTFGLGYVNKLNRPVRVVEHGYGVAQPFTLQPGEVKEVGFGRVAESIDILRSEGQLLAHYRTREIPRIGRGRAAEYVVITPSSVMIQEKESLGPVR